MVSLLGPGSLFGGDGELQRLSPVLVLPNEQPFILGAHTAHQRFQADRLGRFVSTLDPVSRSTGQVVPAPCAAQVGHLTSTKLLEIVRRRHAAGVEEVLVLPNPPSSRLCPLTLRRNAVDRHLSLIDGDRPILTNL